VSLARLVVRVHATRGIVALLLAAVAVGLAVLPARAAEPVTLEFYGTDTCPYCHQMALFLDDLEARYGDAVRVERYEVANDLAARDRWVTEMAARGQEASGVPTTMLGETVWVGFNEQVAAEVETAVVAAIEAAEAAEVTEPVDDTPVGPDPPPAGDEPGEAAGQPDTVIDVPVLGEVDAAARSALGATVLIALIDGFNPCSLWVLTVLLAMVLNAGATRGRVALVGGTFLTVTGLLYGLFIAGVFTVLGFIEHLDAIRIGVAVIALFVGAVNVKDYVAYKQGLSFTIPDRLKPRIYRGGRAMRDLDRPLPAVLGTTIAMAAGIALIELPCTAGFPVIWSGIMRTQGVEGAAFGGLLGLYLLLYVLDELVLFAIVVMTLRIGRFEERHGRLLKLLAGTVMVSLGVVLLVAPTLMENLLAATLVIAGSAVLALLIDQASRRRQGGDEPPERERTPAGTRRR
jgi:thiol-disulfide isomerase/thioredoxin